MITRKLAILDLKLVGVYIVDIIFLFKEITEISETSGKDSDLEAHLFQDTHQAVHTFGDRQILGDLLHHGYVQPL